MLEGPTVVDAFSEYFEFRCTSMLKLNNSNLIVTLEGKQVFNTTTSRASRSAPSNQQPQGYEQESAQMQMKSNLHNLSGHTGASCDQGVQC